MTWIQYNTWILQRNKVLDTSRKTVGSVYNKAQQFITSFTRWSSSGAIAVPSLNHVTHGEGCPLMVAASVSSSPAPTSTWSVNFRNCGGVLWGRTCMKDLVITMSPLLLLATATYSPTSNVSCEGLAPLYPGPKEFFYSITIRYYTNDPNS